MLCLWRLNCNLEISNFFCRVTAEYIWLYIGIYFTVYFLSTQVHNTCFIRKVEYITGENNTFTFPKCELDTTWEQLKFHDNWMLGSAKTKLPPLLWPAEWKAPAPLTKGPQGSNIKFANLVFERLHVSSFWQEDLILKISAFDRNKTRLKFCWVTQLADPLL